MAIFWLHVLILPTAAQVVHQWTRQLGGEKDDFAYSLQVDKVGNAWVAGNTYSSLDGQTNAGSADIFLMKFDAQGVHLWTRQRRGGLYFLETTGLQVDDVGNAWVAGSTDGSLDGNTNAGVADIFLMKFDAQGVHLWTRQHGGRSSDLAQALQVDAVGNAWVAGYTDGSLDGQTSAGGYDVFLMKFDAQGVHQWTRQRGGGGSDYAYALQVDAVGNAWVAGKTWSSLDGQTNAGSKDMFLMKFDAQGVHLWTRQRGGKSIDVAQALQVDDVGNAWVAGGTTSSLDGHTNAGSFDIFLMKFDAQGVHQWTRQRGGGGSDFARGLQVDVNGHAWVAGYTWSSLDGHSNAGKSDIFFMKFDGEGVHQWTDQRGGESWDEARALQVGPIGNAWVAGYTSSSLDGHSNAGLADIFLMKFQAQCSQVTCPAGYVQNPSKSNITCCVRSSTLTSSWTTSTTASTGITTSTSSTSFNSTWNELEKEDFVTQGFLDGMTGASANLDGKVCGYRPGRRYFSYFKRFWIGSALGNYFPVIDHNKPVYIEESSATNYSLPVLEDGGKMCLRMCERNLNCSIWSWHSYTTDHIYGGVCHFFERNAVIDTRLSYDWQKWIGGTCRSQLEVEPRTSTTTAAVDVEIWEKPGILNAANTAATSSEHDSTGLLVAAVVLPLLTTCLCASLGICCCRAKLRQLRGAEAEPQVPNPLAMLPPLARSVKPLIFSWNSRMTAEWPRGKVQKLSVSETAFELSGFQFQFRPGQVRHFTWEDGTVQTVQSIQKNVVWWSTQHPHPAWQRFRWVCTPKCQVENHHDMELTHSEGDGYRCTSCSRLRAAGKHWYCPQHQVHVCPVCAELPPEMPTLGLAATYLVNIFPPLARRVTSAENPNFYDICPNLAHGTAGMGYNRTCPRDGRPHCSIVDALEDAYNGKVTHFVSWCWAYSLNDVVSAIERWVQKSNEDAPNVFLWMCFFCNNQYRIKEEATQTGSDDLKEIFESHLVEAGHMLVLLDTIVQPTYVTRAWCIFESYVSITQEIPMNIILPRAAETFFRETMSTGRINVLTDAVDTLDVRHARAGSEKDEDLIKRIIRTTTGFDAVNHAVKSQLIDQLTVLFRELFRPQPS